MQINTRIAIEAAVCAGQNERGMRARKSNLKVCRFCDALLSEQTETGAAAKLNLSTPAMSRTLGRRRIASNDPMLVRAGRKQVPTPRALKLRQQLSEVLGDVKKILHLDIATDVLNLKRSFTIRSHGILIGQMALLLTWGTSD